MNTFKKPETLLAISSFMGVIGVSIYFYRQQLLMKKSFDSLSENVSVLSKNVGEMKVYGTQLVTMARTTGKIKDENDRLKSEIAEQAEAIEELKTFMESMIYTFEQDGKEIKSPQKVQFKKGKQPSKSALKTSKKSTKKQPKPAESEEEDEDSDEETREDDDRTEEDEVDQAIQKVRYSSSKRRE